MSQLPMPIELKKLAVEGYAKHGRGFIRWVSGRHECELCQYYPEKECESFSCEPNGCHLKRLLRVYNPLVEFVLFVDFKHQDEQCLAANHSASTHLYPRLIPLL